MDLATKLVEPLSGRMKGHEVGKALELRERANGARFQERAAKDTTLEGSRYHNYSGPRSD